jgi:ribA/ribD-fused uncharacterized protein
MEIIKEFKGEHEIYSNFYPSIIKAGWITYPTVEHYFQAMKTLPHTTIEIADHEGKPITINLRLWISLAPTPLNAKQLGRRLELRPDWEDIKIPVMRWGLIEKFKHPELAKQLLATGNAVLEEGNLWHDKFWGIDLKTGIGDNHLGKLLMEVRNNLMKRG